MEQFSLEKYLENPNRKVVTRDGRSARIICTDGSNKTYPIFALIQNEEGKDVLSYTNEGMNTEGYKSSFDLFFAPVKKSGWLNIYRSESGFYLIGNPYKSKEEADEVARANYKNFCTTVKIEWEE